MLKIDKCEFLETRHGKVHSATTKLDEGVWLAHALENGKEVVRACTGVAGERFAGLAFSKHALPTSSNSVVSSTIPSEAPYEIVLPATPTSIGAFIEGTTAAAGTPAAGEYLLTDRTVTFAAADAGKSVEILYSYELTVSQANFLFGGDTITTDLQNVEISILSTGLCYTDQYVITDDWSNTELDIKLGADGKITNANEAEGTVIDAVVAELPSSAAGFIGIRIKP